MNILKKLRHWWRSASTGRFVSADYADHHRDTTVREEEPIELIERFRNGDD